MGIKDILPLANLGALAAVVIVYLLLQSRQKLPLTNGHGLSAKAELQVRALIEELVIKTGHPGGLHELKSKVTQLMWERDEKDHK